MIITLMFPVIRVFFTNIAVYALRDHTIQFIQVTNSMPNILLNLCVRWVSVYKLLFWHTKFTRRSLIFKYVYYMKLNFIVKITGLQQSMPGVQV